MSQLSPTPTPPVEEERSIVDWVSDNPGTMILYMIGCLGAGSLIGGVYLGNRAMRNYNAKKMNKIGNIIPDLGKAFKRLHRPPTSSELQAAVDESIDYHQNPEKQVPISMDHVLEIVKDQPLNNISETTTVAPVYGNARRKALSTDEMASVVVEKQSMPSKPVNTTNIDQSATIAGKEEDISVDFSQAPTTKAELDEMKKKIEKMKARKMARGLAVKAFFGGTVISVVSFGIVGGLCCWIFDVWSFKDFVLKMKTYFRRSATIFNPLGDFVAKTSELVSKPVSDSFMSKWIRSSQKKSQIKENEKTESLVTDSVENVVSQDTGSIDAELENAIEELMQDILLRPMEVPFLKKPTGEEADRLRVEMEETDLRIKHRAKKLLPDMFDDAVDSNSGEAVEKRPNIIVRGFRNIKEKIVGDITGSSNETSTSPSVVAPETFVQVQPVVSTPTQSSSMEQPQTWGEWAWSWVTPSSYYSSSQK